jgi:hypothetical protein
MQRAWDYHHQLLQILAWPACSFIQSYLTMALPQVAQLISCNGCCVMCHVQVYTAEYGGHLIAVKLFRHSTSMDFAAGSHGSQLHGAPGGGAAAAGISSLLGHHGTSSSSGGNVASEAELEAVLSLQYRLCNLTHQHLLQHVAVYPRVFEVRLGFKEPDLGWVCPAAKGTRHRADAIYWISSIGAYCPCVLGCVEDVARSSSLFPLLGVQSAPQLLFVSLAWCAVMITH